MHEQSIEHMHCEKMTKVRFLLMIFYAVHEKRNGTVSSVLGRHRFE